MSGSTMDDCNVVCPYCGAAYQAEAEDFSEHEQEETCGKCGNEYIRWDEVSVTHYAKQKGAK